MKLTLVIYLPFPKYSQRHFARGKGPFPLNRLGGRSRWRGSAKCPNAIESLIILFFYNSISRLQTKTTMNQNKLHDSYYFRSIWYRNLSIWFCKINLSHGIRNIQRKSTVLRPLFKYPVFFFFSFITLIPFLIFLNQFSTSQTVKGIVKQTTTSKLLSIFG